MLVKRNSRERILHTPDDNCPASRPDEPAPGNRTGPEGFPRRAEHRKLLSDGNGADFLLPHFLFILSASSHSPSRFLFLLCSSFCYPYRFPYTQSGADAHYLLLFLSILCFSEAWRYHTSAPLQREYSTSSLFFFFFSTAAFPFSYLCPWWNTCTSLPTGKLRKGSDNFENACRWLL